jgi:hypothetical protein
MYYYILSLIVIFGFRIKRENPMNKCRPSSDLSMVYTGPPVVHYEDNINSMSSSSEEDEITLASIIEEKPSYKIVREFFKVNLQTIKSEEQDLFEK